MKVSKVKLPTVSSLSGTLYHYADSYEGHYLDEEDCISSKDIAKAFFSYSPEWAEKLFDLRNRIVGIVGLKTPDKSLNRKEQLEQFACEPDERLGLFKVFSRSEDEVIIGEDDKHLNFRVSLLKEPTSTLAVKRLTISTTVYYHNAFGRLYFLPVQPFHKLIVPKMLEGMIAGLEGK
ncbi:MAG: DUF2867 domain-containing protein [Saprospiraceae bacterium]